MNTNQQPPKRQSKTQIKTNPSYVQALYKAMDTLWDPESVRQTRELAEQIHLNNQERPA